MADHHYSAGNDIIDASTLPAGANVYGDGGNDTVTLGGGVTFVSGPGNDSITGDGTSQYATWEDPSPVKINLAEGWAEDGYGGRDTLQGIGVVHLGGAGGTVAGSSTGETLFYLGGNATIDLGAGDDVLQVWGFDSSDFRIRQHGDTLHLSGGGRTLTVRNAEQIRFGDVAISPVYAPAELMQSRGTLHSFVESEWSNGWWYAGVFSEPQLVGYSLHSVLPFDIDTDGDLDAILPLSRGYRTGVDTRYHFQVFENDGGKLAYSSALTQSAPFIAGARRSDVLFLERSNTDVFVTIAHDTAIETETRTDIPWRFGDLALIAAKPFADITRELVTHVQTHAASTSGRPTAVDAHSLAIGDVNNDGMDDIVVGDFSGVFALLQTASGTFTRVSNPLFAALNSWVDTELPGATPALLIDMGMGDLDGDGADDLVVGWGHATAVSRVFFNDGQGSFARDDSQALPVSVYGAANTLHMKTFVEDFDRDGDNDLVLLHSRYEPYYGGNYLQFLANDGSGRFTDETLARFGDPAANPDTFGGRLQWTDFWQVVDINGDGAPDIAGSDVAGTTPWYYLNDGRGNFMLHELTLPGGSSLGTWGDFDDDGRIEAIGFTSTWNDETGAAGLNSFVHYELTPVAPPSASRAYDVAGNAGIVAKTIGAVFGAAALADPRIVGIGLHYVDDRDYNYESLMQLAIDARLGDGATHADIVDLLYTNVVGQAPSPQAHAGFVDMLDSGTVTIGELGVMAADHALNVANVDLVGLASSGLDYLPYA